MATMTEGFDRALIRICYFTISEKFAGVLIPQWSPFEIVLAPKALFDNVSPNGARVGDRFFGYVNTGVENYQEIEIRDVERIEDGN
jgi:hypothetical protein